MELSKVLQEHNFKHVLIFWKGGCSFTRCYSDGELTPDFWQLQNVYLFTNIELRFWNKMLLGNGQCKCREDIKKCSRLTNSVGC